MSIVSPATVDPALAAQLGTAARTAQATGEQTLGQDDFLRLLTAQLKNQDPLKPLENEQFVAQMAQFSTVAGIDRMNASLDGLAAKLDSNRIATATSLIGKSVLVPGGVAIPDAQGEVTGAIDLPTPADALFVTISTEAGVPVRTLELGRQDSGLVGFTWDGRDANGNMAAGDVFRIEAHTLTAGQPATVPTNVYGRVRTVDLAAGGQPTAVGVEGVGSVELDQVRRIVG